MRADSDSDSLPPRSLPARSVAALACLVFVGGLAATGVLPGSAPAAHAQGQAVGFDWPAQPLEAALHALSRQAGVPLAVDAALVAGKTAPALQGRFTAREALDRLLAGSGLLAVEQQGGAFVLRRAPSAPAATLGEVTVKAEAGQERASGPVGGYVARRSATATKTDTPLRETPQSVSVVPREQMDVQAADSLDQAFAYTAGVSSLYGGAIRNIGTGFTVRGFNVTGAAPLYLNGTKFPINSLSGSMEPYAFERVELLKGPASILYGQAAPGGIINLVSKRPTEAPLREVEVQAGSWNRTQLAADLAGPATEDGRVRYRLTGLVRRGDSMIRQIPNDRVSLSGALEWQLTPDTLLTLLGSYNKTHSFFDMGKPLDGTLLPLPAGRLSRTTFLGEEGLEKFNVKGSTLGYLLEHRLDARWQVRQNFLVYDHEADNAYTGVYARVNPATPARADRFVVSRFDTDKGLSLDNQLHGQLGDGRVRHHLLLGLDWSRSDFSRVQHFAPLQPIDLFAPVYGARPADWGAPRPSKSDAHQMGVYAQDQIKIDGRWIVLAGARYDTARERDLLAGEEQKSHAFTPRLGLMRLFDGGLAPYYSYSRSFQPAAGADFARNLFKPTTGTQHELGVKYEPPGADASITVAAYEITQRNVLTPDPGHTGFMLQTGEVRSRGLEVEGRASLGRRVGLIAAIATTDAKVTRSNRGDVGTRPVSVPRGMASVWVDYRFAAVPGLSAGLGVRHVGRQEINRLAVPSYTVSDAALRYQRDRWLFALNLKNLADRSYIAACPGVCYFGDERNVAFTARYAW